MHKRNVSKSNHNFSHIINRLTLR